MESNGQNRLLVSGIITTHNRDVYMVERALKSIVNQTYDNIEVIIVDDSSPDFKQRSAVEKMALTYRNSVKNLIYIKHENSKGACKARNDGVAASNGDIIGFLDDDDEWLPDKVRLMLPLIKDHKGLVYCGSYIKNDIDGSVKIKSTCFKRGYLYEELLKNDNFIGSTSFPLIKREALERVKGFDEMLPAAQDIDLWLRISKEFEIDYCEEPLVTYHIHEGDQIIKNNKKKINGWERIIRKNKEFLDIHPDIMSFRLIKIAHEYAAMGELLQSLSICRRVDCLNTVTRRSSVKLKLECVALTFSHYKVILINGMRRKTLLV